MAMEEKNFLGCIQTNSMSAFLISFDGIDGCGKSTQIQLLGDWLKTLGQPTRMVREPGGTALGEALRDILLHRSEITLSPTAEMLMYMASRAQLVREVIEPALASGQHVISDRYLLASVVYQGCAGGLEPATIWSVGQVATGGRDPDLTFILDIDPQTAQRRLSGTPDRMESRGIDYMQRVRDGYLEQIRVLGDRCLVLDARKSIAEIHSAVIDAVRKHLKIDTVV